MVGDAGVEPTSAESKAAMLPLQINPQYGPSAGTRIRDPQIKSLLLYQLSYGRIIEIKETPIKVSPFHNTNCIFRETKETQVSLDPF